MSLSSFSSDVNRVILVAREQIKVRLLAFLDQNSSQYSPYDILASKDMIRSSGLGPIFEISLLFPIDRISEIHTIVREELTRSFESAGIKAEVVIIG